MYCARTNIEREKHSSDSFFSSSNIKHEDYSYQDRISRYITFSYTHTTHEVKR